MAAFETSGSSVYLNLLFEEMAEGILLQQVKIISTLKALVADMFCLRGIYFGLREIFGFNFLFSQIFFFLHFRTFLLPPPYYKK